MFPTSYSFISIGMKYSYVELDHICPWEGSVWIDLFLGENVLQNQS